MAMNRIQFQAGLSMPEFPKDYGTEAQCKQALRANSYWRGFMCKAATVNCLVARRHFWPYGPNSQAGDGLPWPDAFRGLAV